MIATTALRVPTILRDPGHGPCHLVLVPGLVPDGPETFRRQRRLLRGFGSTATITYPYEDFDLATTLACLRRELEEARRLRRIPILIGVSVGGGLVLELLRRLRAEGAANPAAGVVLISPLTCTADLSPLLSRLYRGIALEGDGHEALARGRTFFQTLAARAAGPQPQRHPLITLLSLLTPAGIADFRSQRLRSRIEKTLASIPAEGAIARVRALGDLKGIEQARLPLADVPTLILWGSKERHTIDLDGPGSSRLCRPDLAGRIFSDCEIHWVYDRDGTEVPHAALIKHAAAFNRPLDRFLHRLVKRAMADRPFLERTPLVHYPAVQGW